MIHVDPVPEPEAFKTDARPRALAWLAGRRHKPRRPRDFWSAFRAELAAGFHERCGYSAMYIPNGTIDHFISWGEDPDLAYTWSNYRYAESWINSSKQDLDSDQLLDPFEVGDDWFEILLPSLQLVATKNVPARYRKRAETMLTRLGLRDDERILKQRRAWYRLYCDEKLTLEGLRNLAPLIARAVEKQRAKTK
ncbi:hypothetical protein ACNOYE_05150 [Nannocystaceae bacterium ST9]